MDYYALRGAAADAHESAGGDRQAFLLGWSTAAVGLGLFFAGLSSRTATSSYLQGFLACADKES
jgi:hypothetical protein